MSVPCKSQSLICQNPSSILSGLLEEYSKVFVPVKSEALDTESCCWNHLLLFVRVHKQTNKKNTWVNPLGCRHNSPRTLWHKNDISSWSSELTISANRINSKWLDSSITLQFSGTFIVSLGKWNDLLEMKVFNSRRA